MTRNQAAMALNKIKRTQKQATALEQLVGAAGDDLDRKDEDYLSMQSSIRDCSAKIRQVKNMFESYARDNLKG